jgi:hypothetical protein
MRECQALIGQCSKAGARDLNVVLGCIETCSDSTDHLPIDHNWETTLHLDEVARCDLGDPTVIDGVLQRLTRFLEQRRGSRLACASSTLATKAALSIRSSRIGHPPSSTTATTPARWWRAASDSAAATIFRAMSRVNTSFT